MAETYVVEVTQTLDTAPENFRESLAENFGVAPEKVERLLKRLPGVVTKPVAKEEASIVAGYFQQAGMNAVVKLHYSPLKNGSTHSNTFSGKRPTPPPAGLSLEDFTESTQQTTPAKPQTLLDTQKTRIPKQSKPRHSVTTTLNRANFLPLLLLLFSSFTLAAFIIKPALSKYQTEAIAGTIRGLASSFELSSSSGISLAPLRSILSSRDAFSGEAISFIYVLDTSGQPNASWLANTKGLKLDTALLERSLGSFALRSETTSNLNVPENPNDLNAVMNLLENNLKATIPPTKLELDDGSSISILHEPLMVNQQQVGTLVVGLDDNAITQKTLRILGIFMAASLVPFLLASFLGIWLYRPFGRRLRYLNRRAYAISQGQLDEDIQLHSQDELEQIAGSLERLRISTQEALERLRSRR